MKRILFPIFIAIFATIVIADNRTMVIVKKDGNMHAIHNEEVDSIAFSQFDLPEKYYNLQNDTIINYVEVHDTLYVENEVVVHDTLYITNTVEVHDTIYVEVHDTIYVEDPFNGHDYVDLGLKDEQGRTVYWATSNIGASTPEAYGDYFAWAETESKDSYDWSNYKWGNDIYQITKYCDDSSNPNFDNKYILDPEDDAARTNWGGGWRIPTVADWVELQDKCTWTWTEQNGVKGCQVTGPNGNSIFLPATGSVSGHVTYDDGTFGMYWLPNASTTGYAYLYYFSPEYKDFSQYPRYTGLTIRPVCQ